MSNINLTEDQIYEKLDNLWNLSSQGGYACPTYESHKRAFVFPTKLLWQEHVLQHILEGNYTEFDLNQEIEIMRRVDETIEETDHHCSNEYDKSDLHKWCKECSEEYMEAIADQQDDDDLINTYNEDTDDNE